jgi:hypothetical protein
VSVTVKIWSTETFHNSYERLSTETGKQLFKMSSDDLSNHELVAVKLPKTIVERVSRRLDKSGFKSVDEYVAYVMDQVLSDLEPEKPSIKSDDVFSKRDQDDVEQRLRALGYI